MFSCYYICHAQVVDHLQIDKLFNSLFNPVHYGFSTKSLVVIGYFVETPCTIILAEVRNFQVTKSSYLSELRKMTSHFELLTRNFL